MEHSPEASPNPHIERPPSEPVGWGLWGTVCWKILYHQDKLKELEFFETNPHEFYMIFLQGFSFNDGSKTVIVFLRPHVYLLVTQGYII